MIRFLSLILCVAALAAADPVALAGADKADGWKEFVPKEGKEGKVALSAADGALAMAYDFSAGGTFVGLRSAMAVPADIKAITMSMSSTVDVMVKFRILDVEGRTFSGCQNKLKAGAATTITLPLDKDWTEAWGGTGDSKTPKAAVKQITIQAFKPKSEPVKGTVTIKDIKTVGK